jgi:Holliday junction resolvase RusA-like endonuclease
MLKKSCVIEETFSANKMYTPIARGQMAKSKKYNAWIEKHTPILKEALEPAKEFPIDVEILVMASWDWKYKNDTDNLIKPIVDLLKRADIIPDDTTRYVNSVKVRYLQGFKQATICISYNTTED